MRSAIPLTTVDNAFGSGNREEARTERIGSVYEASKRAVDIFGALAGIVVTAPVMVAVAIAIKATSSGPVLFRQRRLGLDGVEFWCFKFRTMVVNAEEVLRTTKELRDQFHENFKLSNDPRTTRLGSWLRKTSLDELPQLFNILSGAMTFIGPRPIVPPERAKYREFDHKLLTVKPGLSGYWQVYGRSDTTYEQRVQMDMTYIDNRSLLLDLKLLALTVYTVWKRQGAY